MRTKNIFNPKRLLTLVLLVAVGFTGCKKFLDINQNPNNPDTADPTLLLPVVQASVSQLIGNAFQINGGIWAQYWTQSTTASQYKTIDQYNLANSAFDRPWLTIYRSSLINAELIINSKSTVANLDNMKGMAYLLKAYTYQLATDGFGDIPLGDALKGGGNISPTYQSQKSVYDSIFKYVDKGMELLNVSPSLSPGIQDMVFGGSIPQWKAFGNTLKLRAYLRLAYIDPTTAKAGIQALYATTPTFIAADVSMKFTTTGGNENPLYNEMASPTLNKTQNLVASKTAVNAFKRNNDPRRFKFYTLLKDSTDISGIPQGNFNDKTETRLISPPSALVGGNAADPTSATAPVKLLSVTESLFLQAEAAARGWTTGNATTLFTNGIEASFVATGLTVADAQTYYNQTSTSVPDVLRAFNAASTVEGKVQVIITQKYYAMCGFQGFEAWNEWRRTGYPTFFVKAKFSLLGGLNAPLRFLYPNSEITSNSNYPGTVPLTTNVWWGKNLKYAQ